MNKIALSLLLALCPIGVSDVRACGASRPEAAQPDKVKKKIFVEQTSLDQRLAELGKQIADKIEAGQKKTIAVLEFTDLQGRVTDFGRYIAEELITRLYDTSKFKVIERQLLNKVISEQKLSLTGVVDPASAKRLGNILGVDAIVSGTIADRGQSLKVNARIISAETGEIFSAAAAEVAKDNEVLVLMRSGPSEVTTQAESRVAAPKSKEKRAPAKVVVGVYSFELQVCKLSGEEMTCWVSVTNDSEQDREFNLFGMFYGKAKWSRAIDKSGREYGPYAIWIGSSAGSNLAESILVPRVPVNLVLKFRDVTPDATSLGLLRVTFNEGNRSDNARYADFHDVPIVR